MQLGTEKPPQKTVSKLTVPQTAMEILRKRLNIPKISIVPSANNIVESSSETKPSEVQLDVSRAEIISHIESVATKTRPKARVQHNPHPIVVEDYEALDSLYKIYLSQEAIPDKIKQQNMENNSGERIRASQDTREDDSDDEHEVHDMENLLDMLKSSPSLQRLFTTGVQ